MSNRAAPGELEVVRRFLNSERRVERLADSTTTEEWLVSHGLIEVADTVTQDEVASLRRLRSVTAGLIDRSATRTDHLPTVTLEMGIEVRDGMLRLVPAGPTPAMRAMGALVQIVEGADTDGSLERLKRCDECRWAFYDRSRNRSRRWCDMAICGNRVNVQKFRQRQTKQPDIQTTGHKA